MMHRCVFAQTNKCSDITEPITDHMSLGRPGLPPVPRPIRMLGSIGRRVEDLSARLTDLALVLVGTPARERLRGGRLHRGIGGLEHH